MIRFTCAHCGVKITARDDAASKVKRCPRCKGTITVPSLVAGAMQDVIKMYLEDIFTVLANETGCPAISLPLSTVSGGLPFGTQFMAPRGADAWLLSFAEKV